MLVEISETGKPSKSTEEQQAVLKRLGEVEEKVKEASKVAGDAAEKAGKKLKGQDLDKLTLKVRARVCCAAVDGSVERASFLGCGREEPLLVP